MKLRDKIAKYLDKAIYEKKEEHYVPGATVEMQETISYKSLLEISDVIIPMVKEEINKKRKPKEASQNYPDGMITTDKRDAAWLYYEEGGIYYCYDCVRKRVDEVNANKEFKTEIDYDNGERCTFYIDVANEDCEVECCKCGTPLWSNVDF